MSGKFPVDRPRGDSQSSATRDGSSRLTAGRPTVPVLESSAAAGQPGPGPSPTTPLQSSPAQPFFRVPESPRTATAESHSAAAKVAIPRLKRDLDASDNGARGGGGGRHRVNHACEPCRHRKTKCSGERPVCKHCQDFKIACFYADGKRDRVKKQFGTMSEKVTEYERLLRGLVNRVSEEDARLIRSSLDRAAQPDLDEALMETSTLPSVEAASDKDASGGAESEASAGAGSTGALDRTDEDFTREGARETGFIGKNSEITWMQRLKQENRFDENPPPGSDTETARKHPKGTLSMHSNRPLEDDTIPLPEAVDGFTVHETSYHLDDLAITTLEAVDAYEMPTVETAHALFTTYMQRVQPTFPVLGHLNLNAQFQRYLSNPMQRPPQKWLAVINMIFAISARYSHLIQADWKGDERDHLIYFTRARLLALDQDTLFAHPDLQYIQLLSLMSFYLLCIGQMNRAWNLTGVAIRAACALGLNMRNDSSDLKESLKEIRYRLWWALYTIEHRLCGINGRVSCIINDHCTTPLPIPLEEDQFETEEGKRLLAKEKQGGARAPSSNSFSPPEAASATPSEKQSSSGKSDISRSPSATQNIQTDLNWAKDIMPNSSLYFLHLVQLTRLMQSIFQQLYNPASIQGSWSYIQLQIKDLDMALESWYRRLPAMFDFRRKQRDREFYEYRLSLGFSYYATRQTIFRPCLCRLDRKIPGQSSRSLEFNRTSATSCVEAAQDTLRLIPDEPNAVGLMSVGPWWSILHFLVQAATVLMLEISFRAHHMPEEADNLLESSKKAIRWLHALGEDNISAKRAWSLCNTMLHDAAKKIGREITDIPQRPPGRASPSSEETHMSSFPGTGQQQHAMADTSGQGSNMMPSNTHASMPVYQAFSSYDILMQYDQLFPGSEAMGMPNSMAMSMPFANPSHDPSMDYTSSSYHESGQHDQHDQSRGEMRGRDFHRQS